MVKWEYCQVCSTGNGWINVEYWTTKGTELSFAEDDPPYPNGTISRVVADLGVQGWELVTVHDEKWIFKRPVSEG